MSNNNPQQPKACSFVIDIKNTASKKEDKAKATDLKENEEERLECPLCKRKFIQESYEKHVNVCDKVFQDKRNKFDTQKQRLAEIEQIGYVKKQDAGKKKIVVNGTGSIKANRKDPKGSKWNKKSEELRAIIKMNKSHEKGFGLTQPNSNQPIKEEDIITPTSKISNQPNSLRGDNYIECGLCKKKYTEIKYKDHYPDCETKYKDIENKQKMKTANIGLSSIKTYPITPKTNGITADLIPQMQLGTKVGGGVYQRDQVVLTGGLTTKPNCNWGSKPVLNLKFGKK